MFTPPAAEMYRCSAACLGVPGARILPLEACVEIKAAIAAMIVGASSETSTVKLILWFPADEIFN
jgi:hypothetical protein